MKKRNKARRTANLSFSALEQRQMLATLFLGTTGSDTASIEYAGENLVNIRINDTLHENVDSSGGIRINLGKEEPSDTLTIGPSSPIATETITIDHRILDSIFIHNASEIIVDGGDNVVHAFQDANTTNIDQHGSLTFSLARRNSGTINSNVVFTGADQITTGNGQDTFNLSTSGRYLTVNSGGGDDLFRFGTDGPSVAQTDAFVFVQHGTITANGGDGNDRFVFLPRVRSNVLVVGGDGFDVVDHRYSNDGVSAYFFGGEKDGPFYEHSHWREIETFMGAAGQDNLIELRTGSTGTRFDWTVDGDVTTIRNTSNGATVEVHNFNQFRSGSKSLDWFHVKETARDIEIIDGDQIRISSDFELSRGDLSGIKHDISIIRRGSYVMALPPGVNTFAAPLSVDADGITVNPDVFISGMNGEGIIATIESNQTIQLRDGGSIKFIDDQQPRVDVGIPVADEPLIPFQPDIELHGSASEKDVFLVQETWTPTTIYSHDGDDTFFIGSTNEAANGNLERIKGELTIGAGLGTDRLYFNNQSLSESSRYDLSGNALEVSREFSAILPGSTPSIFDSSDEFVASGPTTVHGELRSTIKFNSAVEVVRVNGSSTHANDFRVTSNAAATLMVTGSVAANVDDLLAIYFEGASDPLPRIQYLRDDAKSGSATANQDPFGRVYFRAIEHAVTANVTTSELS